MLSSPEAEQVLGPETAATVGSSYAVYEHGIGAANLMQRVTDNPGSVVGPQSNESGKKEDDPINETPTQHQSIMMVLRQPMRAQVPP